MARAVGESLFRQCSYIIVGNRSLPVSSDFENFFEKANEKATRYFWLDAAALYEEGLAMVAKEDFIRLGTISEEIGSCFYRASMQAESRGEFEERTKQAITAFSKAEGFYERLDEKQRTARMLRCRAACKYLESWLTRDQSEKNRLLTDWFEMASKCMAASSESRDKMQYGLAYNALSFFPLTAFFQKVFHEPNRQVMKEVVEKGIEWGKKALAVFSELSDERRLASAYLTWITCLLCFEWFFIADVEEQDRHNAEVMGHLKKLVDLSQKIGSTDIFGFAHFWLGYNTSNEESLKHFRKAMEIGRKTRDKLCEAVSMDFTANRLYWKAIVEEVPGERRKLAEKAMKFYDKAQQLYLAVPWENPRGGLVGPPGGHAEHSLFLAEWETDLDKKKKLLEKAEKTGIEALKEAEDSFPPNVVSFELHLLGRIVEARSRVEPGVSEKRVLLERGVNYEERAIRASEWKPYVYWNVGTMYNFLADLRAELGYLEPAPEERRKLLEEAALDKEEGLKLIGKQEAPYFQLKGVRVPFVGLYGYQDNYGILLNHLYCLTGNPEHLRKAIEMSKKALESATKLSMVSLEAESYWKIAREQDLLEEHAPASENFERASERYLKAAEKIPQLGQLYKDLASYMLAWHEIEKAKRHHAERQYGMAKEHYEKAANLHEATERWSYLAPNYLAWARLDEAEDLSRKEQTEEAEKLFQQAAGLFEKARVSIWTELEKSESFEREFLVALAHASETRQEYCLGRVKLEEAKMLDRQGNHAASSAEYGSAAEKFQSILDEMPDEMDREELRPIICLSKAWQAMTRAESEASPDLYLEASQLFDEAKEQSREEKGKLLALGHSYFCRALEAGARFEATRDPAVYSMAKKHVETATNYYLKAGFETASEYAKATYRLFDAYLYTYQAQVETDPNKRGQFYEMVGRLLKSSADLYSKARHAEKSEEVHRILESVDEERKLATSLIEVLHAPAFVSTATSFTTPTPTQEEAVGYERFEHAEVQTTLSLRANEAHVGDDIDLEIECTNTGKAPASLVRIEELIPEAFVVKKTPETCKLENGSLNLKGRRLDPLRTEAIKLVLRAAGKGTFTLRPRIAYLDETGASKYDEPKPATMMVKEIGIKGWIKG